MAKAISSEELQLRKRARRRLVGAIALVLIVVVFLPMILDNEPKPVSQDIAIRISAPPEETAEAESAEPLTFRPVDEATPERSEEVQAAAREPEQETKPIVEKKPAPVAKEAVVQTKRDAPKPAPKPEPVKQAYVVQLGAFSDAGNAARLAAKVRESRFKAYTEVVTTSAGKRTRVRVGPYATRADAEKARDRLKARKLTYGEPAIMRADS